MYSAYKNEKCVFICFSVDDMLMYVSNIECVEENKKFIESNFNIKDLGIANVILEIKL